MKYHGGKSQLAKKQAAYEPDTYKIFGDAAVGGGSYLCCRDRPGVSEFANDKYWELTNFFRVLQNDDLYKKLLSRLEATPFSQMEFNKAAEPSLYPDIDRAWAFFVRNRQSRQGGGTDFATRTRRLRRDRNENVSAWLSAVERLTEFRNRIKWVEIREMNIWDFVSLIDSYETFFYIDPPYLPETRVAGQYAVEMTTEEHISLLDKLSGIQGKFMLCGYDSKLYQQYEQKYGWNRIEFQVTKSSSGATKKPKATEIIWRNYN